MGSAVRREVGFGARSVESEGGVPVILDGGTSVRVVAVDVGRPLRIGTRFEYGGRLWEIARVKDHTRGWVARPLRSAPKGGLR